MTGNGNGIDYGSANGQTSVNMASSETFGYVIGDRGTVQVTKTAQMFGWGVLAATSNPVIEGNMAGSTTRRAIFSYSAGQPMFGNFYAPGPRVGFFATQGASAAFTSSGSRLLQEAILRAAMGGPRNPCFESGSIRVQVFQKKHEAFQDIGGILHPSIVCELQPDQHKRITFSPTNIRTAVFQGNGPRWSTNSYTEMKSGSNWTQISILAGNAGLQLTGMLAVMQGQWYTFGALLIRSRANES